MRMFAIGPAFVSVLILASLAVIRFHDQLQPTKVFAVLSAKPTNGSHPVLPKALTAFDSMITNDGLVRSCLVGPQPSDWKVMADKILRSTVPFAFARYQDGELMVMRGDRVGKNSQAFVVDNWWLEGGKSQLGEDLLASLKGHSGQQYFYGFQEPQFRDGLKWLLTNTEQNCGYITYGNLWVNALYPQTKALLMDLFENHTSRLVLIANHESLQKSKFRKQLALPDDAVHVWNGTAREELLGNATALARQVDQHVFCVSGGPLAKVLIAHMWAANPNNQYIDFGSAMDELLKNRKTRPYMTPGTAYSKQIDPSWYVGSDGNVHTV